MASLSIAYLQSSHLDQQLAGHAEHMLACVTFGNASRQAQATLTNAPIIQVHTPVVGQTDADDLLEIWSAAQTVSSGERDGIRYNCSADILFGVVVLQESDFNAHTANSEHASPLQQATKQAFQKIFALLNALEFPYLLRVWNYFPAINEESHGLERYRQFNIGRQESFVASGRSLTEDIPSACALGTASGQLTVYFIAGRNKPVAIENPRQTSAYHYPPDYGPRSPTFSRASLGRMGDQEVLFISGTASIVGHQSIHPDDVAAQTRETLTNIKAVVDEANRVAGHTHYDLENLYYKVYVRRPDDVGIIHAELLKILGPDAHVIYLEAHICREDLLVEIEATGGLST